MKGSAGQRSARNNRKSKHNLYSTAYYYKKSRLFARINWDISPKCLDST